MTDMTGNKSSCLTRWALSSCSLNLTRSASLSEKELKEARVRSQIIAAQLTVPSGSSSRGVQLFNRRRQRVSAFTLESCGEDSGAGRAEDVRTEPSSNTPAWAERSTEDKDRDLNLKNSATKPPPGRVHSGGDIIEEPGRGFQKGDYMEDVAIQERHFLPVNEEEEEEEEARDRIHEIPPGSNNPDPVLMRRDEVEADTLTGPAPQGKLHNGCQSISGTERAPVSTAKQTSAITNRTARPFFSPLTVQSPEAASPVMGIPPPPSYATPPLPAIAAPQPLAFSPPPPPPSYPTPPLPAFTNQPPQTYYSSPSPMSPVMSPSFNAPPQFPMSSVSQYPPMPQYGPPTAPRPSTFVPQPITQIKTGILEEGAAKRGNRKSMFTFKEKTVVAPNPELLSLVQGVDERKKHGNRSVPEPASEEELLALGAEASNFLAKEEDMAEEARAPEWASCLKTSRTRPRAEHRPEQTLTNVSGKGADLFVKRQSRMEKYVVEKQNAGHVRSPSPTMSLPPSWVFPSNMPGRVKAIAKNSDMSAQLSQNLKAQQVVQKPKQKAAAPEPIPEAPLLENGCSKLEMELSRHRPYQLPASLFILNPVKDPISSLPRGAPQSRNLPSSQSFSRKASLPSPFSAQPMSPQLPLSPTRGAAEYGPDPAFGEPRTSSSMAAFSPERVASPRSGFQAPRPTFSAKKAGIAPQTPTDSFPVEPPSETRTPTRTPSLSRRFSSPEGPPAAGTWTAGLTPDRPSTTIFSRSGHEMPIAYGQPQHPVIHDNTQTPSDVDSHLSSLSSLGFKVPVPDGEPEQPVFYHRLQSWFQTIPNLYDYFPSVSLGFKVPVPSGRPASPVLQHLLQSWFQTIPSVYDYFPSVSSLGLKTSLSFQATRPLYRSSVSSPGPPPKDSRCMSPVANNPDSKANHRLLAKNIINAAKRKNSPSPGALSGHNLPISPLGGSHHGYDCHKPPMSPFQSRAFGAQSPTFTSPPPTPTQRICSPVRLYNTRSLTDSDASVESEDSGLRSPGSHSYNTFPRGWGGSLRVKRNPVSTDL
ncbi:Synaptopodin [Liparis tanakae]|uniref:Synaptopodin n=1 Tax=Liparis tanakae TaxID=230148 RepID=A0A4Z2EWV9_9TELE|nr:Synaptopodin [Liparis tanakae]